MRQSHRNLPHGHRGGLSHVRGSPADTTRLPSGSAMRHGSLSWFGILDLAGRGGHGCLMRPRPSRSRCNHMVFLPSAAVALRRCLYEVPPVQAGTSRQKAPAANPVRDFLCLAHFAACLDIGHGARRQLPHRLDYILLARTMGSVCRDCQISENLPEQPSVSCDAGCVPAA